MNTVELFTVLGKVKALDITRKETKSLRKKTPNLNLTLYFQ